MKILDFGLAKLVEAPPTGGVGSVVPTDPGTQPGLVLGTLGYMSPEQVRGFPQTRALTSSRSGDPDELLSAMRRFAERHRRTRCRRFSRSTGGAPARERHIPANVVASSSAALEKLPAMRFQSTEDLAFALTNALSADSDGVIAPVAAPVSTSVHRALAGWRGGRGGCGDCRGRERYTRGARRPTTT